MTELDHRCGRRRTQPCLAQTCGDSSRTDESRAGRSAMRQLFWHATCLSFWTGGPCPKGEHGYDIRDDQALPSLQTAINQKSAHRHGTVRLRQACLAGVVACADDTAVRIVFPICAGDLRRQGVKPNANSRVRLEPCCSPYPVRWSNQAV